MCICVCVMFDSMVTEGWRVMNGSHCFNIKHISQLRNAGGEEISLAPCGPVTIMLVGDAWLELVLGRVSLSQESSNSAGLRKRLCRDALTVGCWLQERAESFFCVFFFVLRQTLRRKHLIRCW